MEQIPFQNPDHQVSMNFYQNNTIARNEFRTFGYQQNFNNQIFSVQLPDRLLLDPPEDSNSLQGDRSTPVITNVKGEGSSGPYETLQERTIRPYEALKQQNQVTNNPKKSSFRSLADKFQQNFSFRGMNRTLKLPSLKSSQPQRFRVDSHDYDEPTDIKPNVDLRVGENESKRNRLTIL